MTRQGPEPLPEPDPAAFRGPAEYAVRAVERRATDVNWRLTPATDSCGSDAADETGEGERLERSAYPAKMSDTRRNTSPVWAAWRRFRSSNSSRLIRLSSTAKRSAPSIRISTG